MQTTQPFVPSLPPRQGTVASTAQPGAQPGIQPDGSLLWWIFRDTATPFPKLAARALKVGFPALFLPLPFPVAPRVAFRRALKRATAKVPAGWGRWRADLAATKEKLAIPPDLLAWSRGFKPTALLGTVQEWEPQLDEEPWHIRLWFGLRCDPDAASLPIDRTLQVFEVTAGGPVSITVAAGAPHPVPGSPISRAMAHRVYTMTAEERSLATAPEIGDGVIEALEDVFGVKLRPGLCALPGAVGVERAEATERYLKPLGHSSIGKYLLYTLPGQSTSETGLAQSSLEMQIQAFKDDLDMVHAAKIGVGALRTKAAAFRVLTQHVEAAATMLTPDAAKALHKLLREAKKRLFEIQQEKQQLLHREVVLERKPARSAVQKLRDGLAQLHVAARKRDVQALEAADAKLRAGQGAALAGDFAPHLRRLRKLIAATIHVHVQGAQAAQPLFKALESAATFFEERAQGVLSTLPSQALPKPAPPKRSPATKH